MIPDGELVSLLRLEVGSSFQGRVEVVQAVGVNDYCSFSCSQREWSSLSI